ncbi:MAG: hypothetical protein ACTHX2_01680 [Microbacterium sp.]
MTDELVAYDYFAERLQVKLRTVRYYAAANSPDRRTENFPEPALTVGGVPYFDRAAADAFIDQRLSETARTLGRIPNGAHRENTSAENARIYTRAELTDTSLVGYDYFAEHLNVKLSTVHIYATAKSAPQRKPGFPEPVTHLPGRGGHPSPRFRKQDADRFIRERIAQATDRKGRLKASTSDGPNR